MRHFEFQRHIERLQLRVQALVALIQPETVQGVLNRVGQLHQVVVAFDQVVAGTQAQQGHRSGFIPFAGDHHKWHINLAPFHFVNELQRIHARYPQVGQYQVDVVAVTQQSQGIHAVVEQVKLQTRRLAGEMVLGQFRVHPIGLDVEHVLVTPRVRIFAQQPFLPSCNQRAQQHWHALQVIAILGHIV